MTPMNREEVFLNGIASGDEVTLEPMTREEAWLQAIINGYTDKLIPMTHKEMFYRQWLDASLVSPVLKGLNPVVVDSHEETVKLADTGFATWTPATTETSIYDAKTVLTETIDASKYDYVAETVCVVDLVYTDGVALKAGRVYRVVTAAYSFVATLQASLREESAWQKDLRLVTSCKIAKSKSTGAAYTVALTNPYGVYSVGSPTITIASGSGLSDRSISVSSPPVYAQLSGTSFTSEAAGEIDMDKSTVNLKTTLYRFNKKSTFCNARLSLMDELCRKDAPWSEA